MFQSIEEKGFDLGQAMAEANRCLLCYDAPCSKGCPAETDPGTFIRKLRMRNVTGAIRTVKQNNVLAGACGVLCPTSELCEKECSATGIDRAIQIGKIQRFLIEHSWALGFKVFEKPAPRKEKVAVVGSGPAGLSCAGELAKGGFQVTVFEVFPEAGGIIRYGVPSYRFNRSFLEHELADLNELGVHFQCSSPIQGKEGAEKLLKEGFQAVFLAPGLWAPLLLKEAAPSLRGFFTATEFLARLREERFAELAPYIRGKQVAVVGGGSVAIDCVESSLKLGAQDVYLVYRRSWAQMPAEEQERVRAERQGAQFLLLNQPVDYQADGSGLKGLKLRRTRLGEPDASGRRKPVEIPGSDWVLPVETVIEAIGSKPAPEARQWYPRVKVDGRGLIVAAADTGATSVKGIFAGGDIVRGPALVVQAVQDGKKAARAMREFLSK